MQCKVPGVMHDKMNFWIDKQSVANDRVAGVSIVTELYITHVRNSRLPSYNVIFSYCGTKWQSSKRYQDDAMLEGGRQMTAISSDQTFHVLHVRHMMFIRVLSYCGT